MTRVSSSGCLSPLPLTAGKACLFLPVLGRHGALPPGLPYPPRRDRDQGLTAPDLPLGSGPVVTQGRLSASPGKKAHLTLAMQRGEASSEPCKGYAACCTDEETESQSKKKGGFPQGSQLGLSPDVHCNPVSSLSMFLGRHRRWGWGCSIPESGSQVQEKQTGQLSFVTPKQETPSSCFLKVQMELGERPERTHCP